MAAGIEETNGSVKNSAGMSQGDVSHGVHAYLGIILNVLDGIFVVATSVTFYLLLPFLLPISLIFRIYRNYVNDKLTERNGDSILLMPGLDALMATDSTENRLVINSLLKMKGDLNLDLVKKLTLQRMVDAKNDYGGKAFPKLTMFPNQLLHRDVWMEELNFNIDDHIFIHETKAPKDKRKLGTFIGDLCSSPLPSAKSPWQLVYLRSEDPKDDFYFLLFRVHHAIADGVSLVRMVVTKMADKVPAIAEVRRFGTRNKWKKYLTAAIVGPSMLLKRLAWPADHSILHGQKLSGQKIVAWSDAIELDLIKRMKTATQTTVNDVLMACLAGAFRSYFQKHQSSPPKDVSAYIPVDLRPPKGKIVLDNQFGLVFLHLPLDSESCLDTLKSTRDRMNAVKSSPEPLINTLTVRYLNARMPKWLCSVFLTWMARKCTMILSNVPGPSEKLTIAGDTIDEIMFWPPGRNNVGKYWFVFTCKLNKDTLGV